MGIKQRGWREQGRSAAKGGGGGQVRRRAAVVSYTPRPAPPPHNTHSRCCHIYPFRPLRYIPHTHVPSGSAISMLASSNIKKGSEMRFNWAETAAAAERPSVPVPAPPLASAVAAVEKVVSVMAALAGMQCICPGLSPRSPIVAPWLAAAAAAGEAEIAAHTWSGSLRTVGLVAAAAEGQGISAERAEGLDLGHGLTLPISA